MRTPKEFSVSEHYDTTYRLREHHKKSGETFPAPTDINNIEYISSTAKKLAGSTLFSQITDNHLGIQFIDYEDRITPTAKDVELIRSRLKQIPGARITVEEEQGGPPTGSAINIELSGDDVRILGRLAEQVRAIVSQIPFVEDVRDDYMASIPSVRIRIDRQKAALFGLSTGTIGFALKTRL